jgi:hypothetical protein
MEPESFWEMNPEYSDFWTFWHEYHRSDERCYTECSSHQCEEDSTNCSYEVCHDCQGELIYCMQYNDGAENWCLDWYDGQGGNNTDCEAEAECYDYDCSEDLNGGAACNMQDCYDECAATSFCYAEWMGDQMEMQYGSCDEFWTWHDSNGNSTTCEDDSFCHAPHDCTEDYGFLAECWGNYCYDACSETQSCQVDYKFEESSDLITESCSEF